MKSPPIDLCPHFKPQLRSKALEKPGPRKLPELDPCKYASCTDCKAAKHQVFIFYLCVHEAYYKTNPNKYKKLFEDIADRTYTDVGTYGDFDSLNRLIVIKGPYHQVWHAMLLVSMVFPIFQTPAYKAENYFKNVREGTLPAPREDPRTIPFEDREFPLDPFSEQSETMPSRSAHPGVRDESNNSRVDEWYGPSNAHLAMTGAPSSATGKGQGQLDTVSVRSRVNEIEIRSSGSPAPLPGAPSHRNRLPDVTILEKGISPPEEENAVLMPFYNARNGSAPTTEEKFNLSSKRSGTSWN